MIDALKDIVGEEHIQVLEEREHPLGNHAPYVVYPHSEQEIASILKLANKQSLKVIPMGGGTKRGLGGVEPSGDLILSLQRLKGIIEHSVGDMVVTVRPGTTMKELSASLAKQGQMIPIDAYWPEKATIGGVVAANDSGPKRIRYGSARDHVIGLRVVYPDGRIIRTGGKTVKNVAGYDMNKLFVGSMGTLGILSELTLKLRPVPPFVSLVLLTFPVDALAELKNFIVSIQDSTLEPFALEVLSPTLHEKMNQQKGFGLAISFEDVQKAVEYEEDWLISRLPQGVERHILRQEEAGQWWSDFTRLPPEDTSYTSVEDDDQFEIALKMGSKNLYALDLVERCHQLGEQQELSVKAHGGAGHGISRAYVKGSRERLLAFVQDMRAFAEELGGYLIVQHAPLTFRQQLEVWGQKPSFFTLLEGIKQAVDPHLILNHKRFVGGI